MQYDDVQDRWSRLRVAATKLTHSLSRLQERVSLNEAEFAAVRQALDQSKLALRRREEDVRAEWSAIPEEYQALTPGEAALFGRRVAIAAAVRKHRAGGNVYALDAPRPDSVEPTGTEYIQPSEIEQIVQGGIDANAGVFAADVVSSAQLHAYVLAVLGVKKIPAHMRWQMRAAVARCTRKLAQDRYSISHHGKLVRVELRAVRNFDAWCGGNAHTQDIIAEYLYGLTADPDLKPSRSGPIT